MPARPFCCLYAHRSAKKRDSWVLWCAERVAPIDFGWRQSCCVLPQNAGDFAFFEQFVPVLLRKGSISCVSGAAGARCGGVWRGAVWRGEVRCGGWVASCGGCGCFAPPIWRSLWHPLAAVICGIRWPRLRVTRRGETPRRGVLRRGVSGGVCARVGLAVI